MHKLSTPPPATCSGVGFAVSAPPVVLVVSRDASLPLSAAADCAASSGAADPLLPLLLVLLLGRRWRRGGWGERASGRNCWRGRDHGCDLVVGVVADEPATEFAAPRVLAHGAQRVPLLEPRQEEWSPPPAPPLALCCGVFFGACAGC